MHWELPEAYWEANFSLAIGKGTMGFKKDIWNKPSENQTFKKVLRLRISYS